LFFSRRSNLHAKILRVLFHGQPRIRTHRLRKVAGATGHTLPLCLKDFAVFSEDIGG
jgi:hypothetical protein